VMVRAGNFTDSDRPNDSHAAFSTDGGANWFQGGEPGGVNSGGTIAAAADGSRFVWAPGDAGIQVVYSVGFGNNWQTSTGVPANAVVESDRVNPMKFYALSGGRFYVSTNGGASFTATAATGLPTTGRFHAVAGREGDIWLAGSGGLWHSTDSGASFTKLANVTSSLNVALGKGAPGASYQAIFVIGTIDGVDGVFRSDTTGATWLRINDDRHQWGNIGEALSGDPRIYGRVYVGTNGRGIQYGDRTGPPVSISASPSASRSSSSPSASPSASRSSSSPSPSPSSSTSGGACTVTYTISGQWQGGFQAAVKITNNSGVAINGWTVRWTFANGQVISQLWSGTLTQTGAQVSVANVDYNRTIAANGGSAEFGFLSSWNATNAKPTSFTVNGTTCVTG
jgi:hypothetical protein